MIKVSIQAPQTILKYTNGINFRLEDNSTLNDLLINMCLELNIDLNRIYKSENELNRFINFYINGEDIRYLDGALTKLKDGDEIVLVPAVAGG